MKPCDSGAKVQLGPRIDVPWSARSTALVAVTAVALVVAVASTAIYLLASGATPKAGDVVIEPVETIVSGDSPQQIEFSLTNHKATAVNVARVNTSCGCTVFKAPDHSVVSVGGSIKLTAQATPPSLGEKQVRIEVYLEGEPLPIVARLTLKGREPSVPSVVWQPTEVIARGKPGDQRIEEFDLLTNERIGTDAWIVGARSDLSDVRVEVTGPKEERGFSTGIVRRKYRVSVAAVLERAGRVRLASISLEFASAMDGGTLRPITLYSDCRAAVEAAPDTVFASVSPDELPKEVIVRFRAPSMSVPLKLKIEPIEVAWLDIGQPRQSGSGSLCSVEVPIRITKVPSEGSKTPPSTKLLVRTNAKDCPLVEIPVYVHRRMAVR